jgi:PAS domain S-box-containing protein
VRELYLRATLDNLPFLFWLKDDQSRFLTVNRQFAETCGRDDPEQVVGLTDLDVWPRDLAELYRADDREVMDSRLEKAVEEPVETEGVRRWIETYKKPVIAADGSLLGTVGFARDITERKEIEQALEQSEQRWHLAVSGSNDGIWDWDPASDQTYYSPRWAEMLGYAPGEIDGGHEAWMELIHPDDRESFSQALDRHLRRETDHLQVEYRLRCRDGSYKWVLSRGRALFDADGRILRMTGSQTDITDRIAAEAAVREHSEQLDAIFALSPDGFASFDASRRVRYVNPAFTQMTGLQPEDIVGLEEERLSARLSGLASAPGGFAGIGRLREDAARQDAHISRPVLLELDRTPRPVLQLALRLSHSDMVSQVLYCRDVTRETAVDQMKSEFLSTAAHELRTPMASILGFSELLLQEGFEPEIQREMLQTVHSQSELMSAILNELLDLARIEARRGKDFVMAPLPLRDVLFEAVALHLPPEGRGAPVMEEAGTGATVNADRKKLLQVVGNILSNAYKYSPEGGEVRVRLLPPREHNGVPMAGFSVQDHGIGMTAGQLERVCERFYRADTSGQIPGTGLGMSIVQEIVGLHGGQVDIESTKGAGTTVRVWLPLLADQSVG